MKKTIQLSIQFFTFWILIFAFCISSNAQKIYQTKSGKVKFFSTTPVEDIEAINNQVDSKISDKGQLVFMVAMRGFTFKNALMQEHFNENYLESSKYPKATFMGTFSNLKDIDFSKDGVYKTTVSGEMKIHGVAKPVTASGTIEIKAGKVSAKSVFKLTITDYGITGKYIGDKIAKEVTITLDCSYE